MDTAHLKELKVKDLHHMTNDALIILIAKVLGYAVVGEIELYTPEKDVFVHIDASDMERAIRENSAFYTPLSEESKWELASRYLPRWTTSIDAMWVLWEKSIAESAALYPSDPLALFILPRTGSYLAGTSDDGFDWNYQHIAISNSPARALAIAWLSQYMDDYNVFDVK